MNLLLSRVVLVCGLAGALLSAIVAVRADEQVAHGQRPISFSRPIRILGSELPQVAGFHIADWNGDGQPDIFGTSGGLQTFQVCYTHKGPRARVIDPGLYLPPNLTEVFPERRSSLGPVEARWTWVGDWFNSGKLDVLVSDRAVILIRNRGSAQSPILVETVNLEGTEPFRKLVNDPSPADGVFLQAVFGDWDGDGKKDLIVNQERTVQQRKQWRLFFCRNVGEDAAPRFGDPQAMTFADGTAVSLEGPSLADIDGDGKLALLFTSTNCEISSRIVNWVAESQVLLCRQGGDPLRLESPVRLASKSGTAIAGGIQAQWVDWEGTGRRGLMVLDPAPGQIRWYRRLADEPGRPPALDEVQIVRGCDMSRAHLTMPWVVERAGEGKRDLILCGNCESRCSGADMRARRFPIRTSDQESLVVGDGQYVRVGGAPGFEKVWDDSSGSQWMAASMWTTVGNKKPALLVNPLKQGTVLFCKPEGDSVRGYDFNKPRELPLAGVRRLDLAPIAFEDFDGDGKKDLWIYANQWEKPGRIVIYPNAGTDESPSFGESVALSLAGKEELKASMPAPRLVEWDGHKHLILAVAYARDRFAGQFLIFRGEGTGPMQFLTPPQAVTVPVPEAMPVPNFGMYASAAKLEAALQEHGGPWVGRPANNPFLHAFWAGDLDGDGGLDIILSLGHHWSVGTHLIRQELWLCRGQR